MGIYGGGVGRIWKYFPKFLSVVDDKENSAVNNQPKWRITLMDKYNDLLIEFMTEKNRIVKQVTGLLIATKPDMDELRSWPECDCKHALLELNYNIRYADGKICPWCSVMGCYACEYSKRNGICNGSSTIRYARIRTRIRERTPFGHVCNLKGMKELVKKTYKKYLKLSMDISETHDDPKAPKNV